MPIELQLSGFIGSISYRGQNVNIIGEPFDNAVTQKATARYQERDSDGNTEKVGEAVNKPTKLDLKEAKAQARAYMQQCNYKSRTS